MPAKSSKAPLTRPVLAAARALGRPHVAVAGYVASARDFQPTAALRGAATIKLQTMARATGYCQRTVQRALDDLERAGVVQRVKRNRYAKSYRVADVLGVFPDAPEPTAPEVQPPIPMAMPDLPRDPEKVDMVSTKKVDMVSTNRAVDNSPKSGHGVHKKVDKMSTPYQASTHQAKDGAPGVPSFTAVSSNSVAPLPSEDDSRPRAGDGRTEARSEDKPNDPVDAIRDRVGSAWPRNDAEARRLTFDALAAGWPADPLVAELRDAAGRYANPGAGVMDRLRNLPDPPREPERVRSVQRPPRDPAEVAEERARAQRWKAEIRAQLAARQAKDAGDETPAESVRTGAITGRPLPAPDGVFDLGSVLAPTRPPEDVLGPIEGFPSDTEILDALDDRDVLDMTDDDYADAYAATGTD